MPLTNPHGYSTFRAHAPLGDTLVASTIRKCEPKARDNAASAVLTAMQSLCHRGAERAAPPIV